MSKISEKIIEKLKKEGIEKIPKWRFVFKRAFVWVSLVLAIVLGSFAVSMVMFQIINMDLDLLPRVAPAVGFGLFKIVPYFWLLIAVLLFVFVYFDFKNTRKGYRYGGGIIVGTSLIIAFVLGAGLYFFKTSERADEFFLQMPFYENMHRGREMIWNVPDRGVISGVIIKLEGDKAIILEDVMENVWDVNIEKIKIGKGRIDKNLFVGNRIKAVGEMISPGKFQADEIRPFRMPR
ncbi:hypothetical protein M0P48_03125 [Candidatus Gracilibacteria bacterium]|nr:hypothetical protein [Candidatus Gracilibacteria bacterium]